MSFLEGYRRVLKDLPVCYSEAEVNVERRGSTVIKYANGEIIETHSSETAEIFVRVVHEKTGYAYTQDLDEEPNYVLLRALNNSQFVERLKNDRLNGYSVSRKVSDSSRNSDLDIPSMKAAAKKLEETVRLVDSNISSIAVEICAEKQRRNVVNSYGLDVESSMDLYSVTATVMAERNGEQYDASYYESTSRLEDVDPEKFKERISASLSYQYDAGEMQTGLYTVLLDSTVVTNIMMTAWQLFSGLKYGDGSSALSGKLGQALGSSCFSVTDSPSHELTGYHYEFDCEGTPSRKERLVDGGRLVGLMHNIASANRLHTFSTGNAGRYALLSGSIPTDIIITPKIVHVEPGSKSVASLLEEMGEGVYITHSYDVFHSINIGSGGFSIPCRGTVIRNGCEDCNVTGLTMSGRLTDLFSRVRAAGNDLYIEEFLRKSYCVGAPSLLIEKLQINGK